jgi:RecJ-like exonuclease
MKIGNIRVRVSFIAIAVFVIFVFLLLFTYAVTGDLILLLWGLPVATFFIIIPAALNYMSQREYEAIVPEYEVRAKAVRIRMINLNMVGQIVRIEGVVERAYFQFLNRPQFLVADRTGEISVKMFTSPGEDIKKGDVVEVLGKVMKRYIFSGDAAVNCVSIRKIAKKIETAKKDTEKE